MSDIKHINLPTPEEVGVKQPANVNPEKYQKGWEHGLSSNTLIGREMLQHSFRMGFRAAKLFLKEERKRRGIVEFPVKWKVNTKVED